MIPFQKIKPEDRQAYQQRLMQSGVRGCEFSFANLYLWGRQRIAFMQDHCVMFSQFDRKTVYPFPVGGGDKKAVLDAIIADSRERGIPCRLTGLTEADMAQMQALYPDRFFYHCDRGSFDYVYGIEDLAELKGRKYQKKRNHVNKFRTLHPQYRVEPLSAETLPAATAMVEDWYARRIQADPEGDYLMEKMALQKALTHYDDLGMETLVLLENDRVLALTMASALSADTMDVHFEKAREDVDGAYPVINMEFARYLREKYPALLWLNREEDMGLEGLRKAKESYYPHHLQEKCWAHLREEEDDY